LIDITEGFQRLVLNTSNNQRKILLTLQQKYSPKLEHYDPRNISTNFWHNITNVKSPQNCNITSFFMEM